MSASASQGVKLVRYAESHIDRLFEAATESVDEVGKWLPWCHPSYRRVEADEWIRSQIELFDKGEEYEFAIESSDGTFLGGCGLNQLNTLHRCANLGYWVRSAWAGQGVATRAATLVANWALENTELVRLEIVVAVGNVPSLRVAEKVGALREGTLRKRILIHGVWHDAAVFSITRASAPTA